MCRDVHCKHSRQWLCSHIRRAPNQGYRTWHNGPVDVESIRSAVATAMPTAAEFADALATTLADAVSTALVATVPTALATTLTTALPAALAIATAAPGHVHVVMQREAHLYDAEFRYMEKSNQLEFGRSALAEREARHDAREANYDAEVHAVTTVCRAINIWSPNMLLAGAGGRDCCMMLRYPIVKWKRRRTIAWRA